MSTVKLKYSAMSNISFYGVIDTKIEWDEWREMNRHQQAEVMSDALFELVDIDVEEDPGE